MKELKETTQIIDSEPQITFKRQKRVPIMWKLAKQPHIAENIKNTNVTTEVYFNLIVAEVKRIYAPYHPTVFERDYRECNNEHACSMHTWATSSVYLHLECSMNYQYWFRYDFLNCPFEAEITSYIAHIFSRNSQSHRVFLSANTFEFYKGLNPNEDDQQYFSVL